MKKLSDSQLDFRILSLLDAAKPAGKKTVMSRQNKKAPDRQTPVASKWTPIREGDNFVELPYKDFRTPDGMWDEEALYRAKQAYPKKEIFFKKKGTTGVFYERSRFFTPNGEFTPAGWDRYQKLKGNRGVLGFFDVPASDPAKRGKEFHVEKPVPLADRPGVKDLKVTNKAVIAEKRRLFAQREQEAARGPNYLKAHPISKTSKKTVVTKPRLRPAVKKTTVTRTGTGVTRQVTKFGTVYYSSKTRMQQRAVAEQKRIGRMKKREIAGMKNEALRQMKRIRQFQEHRDTLARRQIRANKFFASKPQINVQRTAASATNFGKSLRELPGFGRTPVKMLMARSKLSGKGSLAGNVSGKRAVMAAMSHGEKYPARNLSRAGAFAASAMGPGAQITSRQTLSDVAGQYRGSLGTRMGGQELRPSVRGGSMFTTGQTIQTGKFPEGGAGILFRIDTKEVMANLIQRYPAALRAAAITAADGIGRKMLDIVEPYVPKDTGLMYTSAETNVEQTAAGMVDMTGGEAYPSDQMFGVSISYNTPYAELVYFDESKAHGAAYNAKHGTSEKGEKETARWIEKAFQQEKGALAGLTAEYAAAVTAAMNFGRVVSFTRRSGEYVSFMTRW